MTLTREMFAVCPAPGCTEWGPQVFSEEEKRRIEEAHARRLHPATIEAVTALVAGDPMHARERVAVEEAIRVALRRKGGRGSANDWRPLIPSWVTPQLIGSVVNGWVGKVLIPTGEEVPNLDTEGRNTNKKLPVYELREVA